MIFLSPIAVGLCVWVALGVGATGFPIQAVGTAFAVVLIAAVLIVWKIATIPAILAAEADERHKTEMSALQAERDQLRTQLEAVRAELAELKKPAPPPARNPDGVYQHGRLVGTVAGAIKDIAARRVTFERLASGGEFAADAEFEYHDLVLKIQRFDARGEIHIMGGKANDTFTRVVCELVRRT